MVNVPMYQGALAKARKKARCSCHPEARWITVSCDGWCIVCQQPRHENYRFAGMIYFYPELPGFRPVVPTTLSNYDETNWIIEREGYLRWAITGYVCPACRKDSDKVLSAFRQYKERMGASATHDKNCDVAEQAGFGER